MSLQERLGFGRPPVFLMDGTAFVYRSFYAQRHLSRADGFPTNAITLLARALLRILRQENPEYFLFVMDGKGPNFRRDIYEQYKANRDAMPEDLALQLGPVRRLVSLLGITVHVTENCEADDCIASLATRFSRERPVIIVSGDKDLKQCLASNVVMWDPGGREEKLLTLDVFEDAEAVRPDQWADMQALIGDTSDNIPGVPGIGPKTARLIMAEYPSLEAIRDNLAGMPERWRAKLEPHMKEAFVWRQLTTLKRDACAGLSLENLEVRPIDAIGGGSFAREFELTTIGREIAALARQREKGLMGLVARETREEPAEPPASRSLEAREIAELPMVVGETVALVWPGGVDGPWHVAVSAEKEWAFVGDRGQLLSWAVQAERIIVPAYREMLLWQENMGGNVAWEDIRSKIFDLSIISWLLDPDYGDYAFAVVARRYGQTAAREAPARAALAIGATMASRLAETELTELYERLELPLAPVLARIQRMGIAIDPAAFGVFLEDVQRGLDDLTRSIYAAAGGEFKIRSTRQLGEVLYGRLGLKPSKMTSQGHPATDQASLEKLAADHPVVADVLEYRRLEKMRSTYLEPLPRCMDAGNRVHSSFNQTATATGRISSSDPNLQNIPIRGDLGKRMRGCFVAGPGNLLVAADYSQIELRVLAHLSRDEHLLAAFHAGEDIHSRTASLIFDVDQSRLTADERRMAKTINFGLLYGMGAQKLARELNISINQAREFMERYFARLTGLKEFYEEIREKARLDGFVRTMAGRKRWLPEINSRNGQSRAQAERQAVNTVIQGSAADIMKLAMLAVSGDGALREAQARVVLQVHDELLVEAPEAEAEQVGVRVSELMAAVRPGGAELSVPLKVEWGRGHNWAEAH